MHWGREYLTSPTEQQKRQAAHLESLGVHIVVGHHPHVLEDHAVKRKFLVSYSLGNFLFAARCKNVVSKININFRGRSSIKSYFE